MRDQPPVDRRELRGLDVWPPARRIAAEQTQRRLDIVIDQRRIDRQRGRQRLAQVDDLIWRKVKQRWMIWRKAGHASSFTFIG